MQAFPTFLQRALREQGRDLTILVVRLAAMGDILRTLPVVRLLRRELGQARIFWAVDDRWSIVLQGHPDLDGLVLFPRREWQQRQGPFFGWPGVLTSFRRFRADLRQVSASVVLDFHGNLRSGATGWLSGAPVRLGYDGHQQKELNRRFNTHHTPSGSRRTPRMERNMALYRALGLPDQPLPTGDLPLAEKGRSAAADVRTEIDCADRPFAVISPGASRSQAYKKPPPALVSAACRRLAAEGVTPLVVWGPGEEDDASAVTGNPESKARLAPRTDLPCLAALLDRARLFVGGDSGPLHMACAVGCPVVGIYGPTDPQVNQPWAVPFRAVYAQSRVYSGIKREDRAGGAFEGVSTAQVETAVQELLEETAGR